MVDCFVVRAPRPCLNYQMSSITTPHNAFAQHAIRYSARRNEPKTNQSVLKSGIRISNHPLVEEDSMIAQYYLRSVGYDYDKFLPDFGSRAEKRYFLVKQGGTEQLMVMVVLL